jgi:hypothetical protein
VTSLAGGGNARDAFDPLVASPPAGRLDGLLALGATIGGGILLSPQAAEPAAHAADHGADAVVERSPFQATAKLELTRRLNEAVRASLRPLMESERLELDAWLESS